jgi:hypothetical protein
VAFWAACPLQRRVRPGTFRNLDRPGTPRRWDLPRQQDNLARIEPPVKQNLPPISLFSISFSPPLVNRRQHRGRPKDQFGFRLRHGGEGTDSMGMARAYPRLTSPTPACTGPAGQWLDQAEAPGRSVRPAPGRPSPSRAVALPGPLPGAVSWCGGWPPAAARRGHGDGDGLKAGNSDRHDLIAVTSTRNTATALTSIPNAASSCSGQRVQEPMDPGAPPSVRVLLDSVSSHHARPRSRCCGQGWGRGDGRDPKAGNRGALFRTPCPPALLAGSPPGAASHGRDSVTGKPRPARPAWRDQAVPVSGFDVMQVRAGPGSLPG